MFSIPAGTALLSLPMGEHRKSHDDQIYIRLMADYVASWNPQFKAAGQDNVTQCLLRNLTLGSYFVQLVRLRPSLNCQ